VLLQLCLLLLCLSLTHMPVPQLLLLLRAGLPAVLDKQCGLLAWLLHRGMLTKSYTSSSSSSRRNCCMCACHIARA
jgi:hypothetical protein